MEVKMSVIWFATLAAGLLASIGVVGVFVAAVSKNPGVRKASFKVGTYGFTLGGLALMLGGAAGWFESKLFFGGLLMVLVGTGSNLLPTAISKTKTQDESAR
jgi:hypothetical protein